LKEDLADRKRLGLTPQENGAEIARLDRVDACVWQLANGATSIDAIAHELAIRLKLTADKELVWTTLDRLFDFGLLEERVAPPAGNGLMSRRGMLKDVGRAGGLIGLAAAVAPTTALAKALAKRASLRSSATSVGVKFSGSNKINRVSSRGWKVLGNRDGSRIRGDDENGNPVASATARRWRCSRESALQELISVLVTSSLRCGPGSTAQRIRSLRRRGREA
jgi:hypothetical protein